MDAAQIKPFTREQLVEVAYRYHPRLNPEDFPTDEALGDAFWGSPEQQQLATVQRMGIERHGSWLELVRAVQRTVPDGYVVADRTYPRYDPTYMAVVDGPLQPGPHGVPDERHFVIHLSYLVPYYFYYEMHSRRVDGMIQRDPLLYEVTPVFADVLASFEREIAARYGYLRLEPEVAATPVPGLYINGYHDMDEPPTLQDALFSPQRW